MLFGQIEIHDDRKMVRRMVEIRNLLCIANRSRIGIIYYTCIRNPVIERFGAVHEIDTRLTAGRRVEIVGVALGDNVDIRRISSTYLLTDRRVSSSGNLYTQLSFTDRELKSPIIIHIWFAASCSVRIV